MQPIFESLLMTC